MLIGLPFSLLNEYAKKILKAEEESEILFLKPGIKKEKDLPTVLFTSKSLVTVKLALLSTITVPINVFFPSLKTLELRHIRFVDGDSVQRLFAGSPMLEDSFIFECDLGNIRELNISNPSLKRLTIDVLAEILDPRHNFLFVINVPSLVYFKYVEFVEKGYTIENMHSLVKADICISLDVEEIYEDHHQRALAQLFQGIGNVKSLYLTIDLDVLPVLSSVSGFLEFLPNLETLVLRDLVWNEVKNSQDAIWSPPEKVPSCLLFHLKEIEFQGFRGHRHLIEMIKYFLKNGRVLEKLTIGFFFLKEKDELRITKELLSVPRSSKKCQVVTL
ncbi:hypothetical protein REPUB_Repub05bG0036600 [Reevesia pubescens]